MSYRNVLLRPKPIVNPPPVEDEPDEELVEVVTNIGEVAPAAAAPNNKNNNANWLSKIKINTPPPDPEPFRNVNFPSPPSTPGANNTNYAKVSLKKELTEEENRLLAEDPAGFLFLPDTLIIRDTPYYIYSQHYSECATDSFLNILFFADGYRQYFAKKADVLYKKLRNEHRYDLLHYTPYFKSQVVQVYEIANGTNLKNDQFEKLIDIFAKIVRRYIFVMLLNQTGYNTAEKLAKIIETECPVTVKPKEAFGRRRKSINVMAGIDIHDAILEFLGQTKREKNNTNELIGKGLATTDILKVLNLFMQNIFAPSFKKLHYQWHPFEQTGAIEPHLQYLKAVYLAPSASDKTKAGHAVSIFQHTGKWYLAENNLGYTLDIIDFDPMKYFGEGRLAQFFIYDFQSIDARALFRGNNGVKVKNFNFDDFRYSSYEIERLQQATFYGFLIYPEGEPTWSEQYVIAIAKENLYPCFPMKEEFESDQRLYFFAGSEETNWNWNMVLALWNENKEVNPNLPGPFKRTKLKKTKRRPKPKGKRRTTQRAKPPRANQTLTLGKQVENVTGAANNTSNEQFNENMTRYFNRYNEPPKPKARGLTLGNFV